LNKRDTMKTELKSGKQILDEFFAEIKTYSDVDRDVVNAIVELYKSDKLSDKNLSNVLLELREKFENGED